LKENVENNKQLKEAVKSRLAESRNKEKSQRNLKRKIKEKINSLMKASEYKISAADSRGNLSFHSVVEIDVHRKRRWLIKRKLSRSTTGKKSKQVMKKKKKNSCCRKKNQKTIR